MQIRSTPEQRGEEEEAEGYGQVPIGPRHQRTDPGGGVQRGLRGAEEITPHLTSRQETLQDRDPQTGYMLHLLSQSRVGCLKMTPPPSSMTKKWFSWVRLDSWASFGYGKVGSFRVD